MHPFFWLALCFGLVTADRPTRSLLFRKGSSFFYRVNYKLTMLPYTPIFAYAAGFKLVWELPSAETNKRRTGRSVDDVYQAAEVLYDSHGFDGRSCLLKNICQAMEYVSQRDGTIAKILQLLIGSYTANGLEPSLDCDVHIKNCPLQLVNVDPFIIP